MNKITLDIVKKKPTYFSYNEAPTTIKVAVLLQEHYYSNK